jgi:hypothetical protein
MSRLDIILLKTERAEHHIRELDARIESFRKLDAYKLVVDNNPQIPERIYKVRPIVRIPVEFSLIAGDAIHNLRSALDHLACHLVAANKNSITNRTEFPIYNAPPKRIRDFETKVKGIDTAAISLIEAAQPYRSGTDELWKLQQLDIDDKHKLLLAVGFVNQRATVTISTGTANSATLRFEMPFMGAIPDDGAELGRISGAVVSGEMQEKLDFSYEIAFAESQVARGEAVLETLHKLAHAVRGVIMQFARFLVD